MAEQDGDLSDALIRLVREIEQLEATVEGAAAMETRVEEWRIWLAAADDRDEIAQRAIDWQRDFTEYTQTAIDAAKRVRVVMELVQEHPLPDFFRGLETTTTAVEAFCDATRKIGELLLEADRKLNEKA
jgi:hypothetical protein